MFTPKAKFVPHLTESPRLPISRRTLFRASMSGAATAALSAFLPVSQRRAEAAALPKRLLLVYWSGGSAISQDWPIGGETDFTLPPLVSSLDPFKKKMIVFKNLRRGMDGSQGAHQGGTGGVWSGARMVAKTGPGPWATLPSINNVIVNKVPQPVPFPTFDLDVMSEDQNNLRSKTLFDLKGNPIGGEQDPSRAFDRVFTDGVTAPTTDPKLAERLRAERKSVLDIVSHDLKSIQARMGGQDRQKVEQHLAHLRSIEQRITAGTGASSGAIFMPPSRTDFPKIDFLANDNYPRIGKMHIDLAVAALASDRSRMVTLQFSQGNGDIIYNWLGVKGEHHALTHQGTTTPSLDKINEFHFQQFAYLLGKLDAIREGDATLLDNTAVVFANEAHDGHSHSPDPSQAFMVGSGGGHFKTGRHIVYPPKSSGSSGRTATPNHSQLLVSLCQYMGAEVTQVSDPSIGPGGTLPLLR